MTRIYHTWDKWECYPSGFYEKTSPGNLSSTDCEKMYHDLLADERMFAKSCLRVTMEWKNSCEHYLTNPNMNRIAWMGQAALCITHGIPSMFRGGYHLLNEPQQHRADQIALEAINDWMFFNGYPLLSPDTVKSRTESDLY